MLDDGESLCNGLRRDQNEHSSGDCYPVSSSSSSTSRHVSNSYFPFEAENTSTTASRAGVTDLHDDTSSANSVVATTTMTADDLSTLAPPALPISATHQHRMLPFSAAALLPTVGFMMEQVRRGRCQATSISGIIYCN